MNISPYLRRTATATVAVAAALLAAPATAPAETSCLFAFGVVQVNLTAVGDRADLLVAIGWRDRRGGQQRPGALQRVRGTPAGDQHGRHPGAHLASARPQSGAIFEATASPRAGTARARVGATVRSSTVNLNNAPDSSLSVSTDAAGGSIRFGTGGINPNATPVESVPDADIFVTQSPAGELVGLGSDGPDTLGAQGGAGTGDARGDPFFLARRSRARQPDRRRGARPAVGWLGRRHGGGGRGNDTLVDGGGRDDDTMDGGPGIDLADYDGPLPACPSISRSPGRSPRGPETTRWRTSRTSVVLAPPTCSAATAGPTR